MQTRKEKYHEYLKSDPWVHLREFALFKNWIENKGTLKCEDCGKTGYKGFDVHHWQYPTDLTNDHPKYHVVLCHRCHGIRHDKIELSEEEEKEIEKKNNADLVKFGLVFRITCVDNPVISNDEAWNLSLEELEKIIVENNIPEL